MKKYAMLAAVALAAVSAQANAQDSITFAGVTGPTGTIWNTSQGPNYALFVRTSNISNYVNPNNEVFSVTPATNATSSYLVAGEGFRPGETQNSDPLFTLTLNFSSGNTLVGTYNPDTNVFLGGSSFTSGGFTYSLTEFSWERNLQQIVQPKTATPGGDSADYNGNFNVNAITAVPEPAAWAMMIVGVGAVGGSMRARRAKKVTVSFA